jgi:hypothetical protein
MMSMLLTAVAAGAGFGLARLNAWALIPATVAYLIVVIVDGIVAGSSAGTTVLAFF